MTRSSETLPGKSRLSLNQETNELFTLRHLWYSIEHDVQLVSQDVKDYRKSDIDYHVMNELYLETYWSWTRKPLKLEGISGQ